MIFSARKYSDLQDETRWAVIKTAFDPKAQAKIG